MTASRVFRGHVFHVAGAATLATADAALVSIPDGVLVVERDGTIGWVGPWSELPAAYADAPVTRTDYLLPGFVDTHLHFPQVHATDAYGGGQLLGWLERCIFPAESRFAAEDYAATAAEDFVTRRIAAGTTAAMVFGSAFPAAQDALFAAHQRVGLRLVSGRGVQTVGPPSAAPLITDEDRAVRLVADEIDRWHGRDTPGRPREALLQVAVVPRFSLSVTRRTLAALGELYDSARSRGVYFHTHLSENVDEIAAVRAAYEVENYLDTYDGRFGSGSALQGRSLLGRRSLFAHAVHCTEPELARLAETQSSIAHCPTSQLYLGSGTMPWRATVASGVTIATGTDVGAGDEWLVSRVLNDAYKVHLSEPGDARIALTPAELLYTGTLAGAQALDQEGRFGNFDVGKDADFLLIEETRVGGIGRKLPTANSADDRLSGDAVADRILFAVLLGLRERAIRGVFVRGLDVTIEGRDGVGAPHKRPG